MSMEVEKVSSGQYAVHVRREYVGNISITGLARWSGPGTLDISRLQLSGDVPDHVNDAGVVVPISYALSRVEPWMTPVIQEITTRLTELLSHRLGQEWTMQGEVGVDGSGDLVITPNSQDHSRSALRVSSGLLPDASQGQDLIGKQVQLRMTTIEEV